VALGTRQVHAFTRAQHATANDFGAYVVADRFEHAQDDLTVGEVDVVTVTRPMREVGQGRGDMPGIPPAVVAASEHEFLPSDEFYRIAEHHTATNFWARQVNQHPDAAPKNLRQLTHLTSVFAVCLHVGVRSVEPHHVGTGFEQLPHGLR
jgi:hypothetical protein